MAQQTPFIGRRRELGDLKTWLADARAGTATIALVSGELGIGKTRLVEEFIRHVRETQDALLGVGRWYEARQMPAYLGLREALWPLVSHEGVRSALEAAAPRRQELARLGPEFAEALSLHIDEDTSDEQFGLWRAIAGLLQAAASRCPVVLSLDDIQWADRGSLGLLGFLGSELRDHPVMIVATYRSEDVPQGHPLNSMIADLVRAQVLKTVYLGGLTRTEVGELASGVSVADVPSELVEMLYRETGGNPLFISELLWDLQHPAPRGRQPVLPSASGPVAPERLQQVIDRRLRAMSADCRLVLDMASILGRQFDLAVLATITGLSHDTLLAAIDEAIAGAMLDEVASHRFAFHHPVISSVVGSNLTPTRRIDAHLRAARALQDHFGPNATQHAREIAAHLVAAGSLADPAETATFCLLGARQLRSLFAFDEASELLQQGLGAAERLGDDTARLRAELLIELGYAQTALGEPEDAQRTYRKALAIYKGLGDFDAVTDARRWLAATLARYGRWNEVLEVTEEALAEAEEKGSYAYVGLLGSHTMAAIVAARFSEAERWYPKLLQLAFDDSTRAVAHHVTACWHSYGGGEPGDANDHFFRARELFLRAGQDATAAGVSLDHAFVAHFLGYHDIAIAAEEAAESLATRTGRVAALADLHALRSIVHVHSGRWDDAHRERELWRTTAHGVGGRTVYGQLAERGEALEALWRRGPDDAASCLTTEYPLRNEPLLTVLALEAGRREEAAALTEAIQSAVPADGRGLFWLSIALPLTSSLCSLQDARAADWFPALARHEQSVFVWFSTDVELARIAEVSGDLDDADARFTAACTSLQERGLAPLAAHGMYHHALMLRRRRRAGDRARAERLLREAARTFGDLGAEHMQRRIEQILTVRRPGRPPAQGRAGLTPREVAVLTLVAQGKSTRQVAEALVISVRTVSRHLENIYAKLGVSSRTAAATKAIQDHLIKSRE